MLEFHYSCGIIPFYKDKNWTLKVLVLRGRHNHWWFPKGHIETWENCKTTALREFEEETWIPADYINVFSDFKISDEYWFVLNWKKVHKKVDYFVWILKDWFEKFVKPQKGEIDEIKLISPEEALQILEFDWLKRILGDSIKILKSDEKEL
jgi:8-oxo-dGTP pyrophosphatase MutT (NUDIX family)